MKIAARAIALALVATSCGGGSTGSDSETAPRVTTPASSSDAGYVKKEGLSGVLTGAGATFPNPVIESWQRAYTGGVQPGSALKYQAIGSGGGIEQFLLEAVDFGVSERHLRDADLEFASEGRGCPAFQVPFLFGSVTIVFGDPSLDELILNAEVVADIYERRITSYDDPKIAALNPGRSLPDRAITPVRRSDGSGTTSVLTTYLEWAATNGTGRDGNPSRFGVGAEAQNWTLGSGTEVQWPAEVIGARGTGGMAQGVLQNIGGLGYVNQAYALLQQLPSARIVNSDGNPVKATVEATTEALQVLEIPDDFQFDILGVGGGGYPITGTAWVYLYECGYSTNTADMLKDFWTWATQTDEASALAVELGYAPIGMGLRPRVYQAIQRVGS